MRNAARLFLGLSLGALSFVASPVNAHFVLEEPPANNVQDAQGNPQKDGPCGGDANPTGDITAFQSGQTITITIDETIFHPGHYRVAIAQEPSGLPEEPPVTIVGSDQCGSVPIMDPPVFPVLADGMLLHETAFPGPQTFEVTLPDDYLCEGCTLQILEFMSNHAAPCFYYHCATVTVQSEPVVSSPASSSASGSSSGGNGAGGNGNGAAGGAGPGSGGFGGEPVAETFDDDSCSAAGSSSGSSRWASLVALLGAALAVRVRRSVRAAQAGTRRI